MKKARAANTDGVKNNQNVKVVYPVPSPKINPSSTIQKQRIANLTLYRSGSSGRVLFVESGRAQ
jgi:hypothetical protein